MLNPTEWNKNYDGWVGIKRYGFDINDMNENIRDYKPVVTKIDFWNGYASLLVEDQNGMVPAMWMDYDIDKYGDPTGDWNQTMFFLNNPSDVEKKIYQDDPEVFDKADSAIFDYLGTNGYMRDLYPNGRGYAWTDKADMESGDITYKPKKSKNIRTEAKYVERRRKFGLGGR